MNSFISPNGRTFFSQLKQERERKINSLINNLKINDVKEDAAFENTATRIKQQILFTPVLIGEPKLRDYEFKDVPLSMQQQLIGGMSRNHYIHKISFPFTGDHEFFSYKPEQGFSFSSSDQGLIIPYGNSIEVEVDLPELNPANAISQARHLLNLTFQFVSNNNASVHTWNAAISHTIDELLKNKREELIRVFGRD